MRDSFSHSYVCMYICMYVSIYRERVCVRNKSIVCGNRFVFTPFVCIMYELCVIECVCIPLFFFLKGHKHTQRTHFQHLQSPSICQPRSWCRQSSLRYMYTRYHTQQRAELDRVPFYFMNFSPTVTSNMCRGT
jgi:hypothetical protein